MLIQDGNYQILIAGGADSRILQSMSRYMSWFDRRIELLIVPTYASEDITGLPALLDRYNVGAVLLPSTKTLSDFARSFVAEITRRNIPYRFADYGERVTAGGITLRIMSGDPIALRADVKDLSLIILGDASAKYQQNLLQNVPKQAFPAKLLYAERHGTRPPSIVPGLLAAVAPALSFDDLPYDATFALQGNSWLMRCVHETDLPFLQHYCMNK